MHDFYLDNIPYDLLNIIFNFIKPSIKYKLNREYFYRYYHVHFKYVNNCISYLKYHTIRDKFVIKNYSYIKYLIKNDVIMIFQYIVDSKYKYDKSFYIVKKPLIYENHKYKNFIDFCNFFSNKFKTNYIKKYISSFISTNNVSITNSAVLSHTNNKKRQKNKNKIWIA